MRVAHVVVDVPSQELDTHFDYSLPDELGEVEVGSCVLVDFGRRPVVGYVTGLADESSFGGVLKAVRAVVGGPYFSPEGAAVAEWIAQEYLCPLSEAVRLFTPPGGTPRAVKSGEGPEAGWELRRAGVGPVDDRWAILSESSAEFVPRKGATLQRAVLDALAAGPVRVAELSADLGSVDGALRALETARAIVVERRRRFRELLANAHTARHHAVLSQGQSDALAAIAERVAGQGGVVLLDGVTGSGKTEVYLRAIEQILAAGGSACVLVPEISLTPQTVGRFRSRFGESVAVLHSRLSAGERFDQWDRVRRGEAHVVVGARSALFAPMRNLKIVVIDEEHESSYKQGSSPRYHARAVAERLCSAFGATLVLGSASPSMESRQRCVTGEWKRVELPERVTGQQLPPVHVVDLAAEFSAGNKGMFSRELASALLEVSERRSKAVVLLNRRGFASFLLCRECGFVPTCESCSTSLTYHEVGGRLSCHHCGATRPVPPKCPTCGSPYLRQFGAGTQRVAAELESLLPGWPVVRMDADTTKGKGAHERLLAEFEALPSGVLLGTQMIAKGLDYPEVTLVGVITADVTLNLPDFRAGERTYQLLEQVAGRAGRGTEPGRVVIQTYWPSHAAVRAAAAHNPEIFYTADALERRELGYPPFGRLINVLIRGRDEGGVTRHAGAVARALRGGCPDEWGVLGPSPAALTRLKGVWRWHVLVKTPEDAPAPQVVGPILRSIAAPQGISVVADVDPLDLL